MRELAVQQERKPSLPAGSTASACRCTRKRTDLNRLARAGYEPTPVSASALIAFASALG